MIVYVWSRPFPSELYLVVNQNDFCFDTGQTGEAREEEVVTCKTVRIKIKTHKNAST